jgi:hypothetical protein
MDVIVVGEMRWVKLSDQGESSGVSVDVLWKLKKSDSGCNRFSDVLVLKQLSSILIYHVHVVCQKRSGRIVRPK